MGNLTNQPPRNFQPVDSDDVRGLIERAIDIANDYSVNLDQVLKAYEIRELERRNDLYVRNGNIFDEQMADLGELLENWVDALNNRNSNDV